MQITITSTGTLTEVNGALCRLWTGTTDRGVPVHVFVRAVMVKDFDKLSAGDRFQLGFELRETAPPLEVTPLARLLG
jgi:hypothetical protein